MKRRTIYQFTLPALALISAGSLTGCAPQPQQCVSGALLHASALPAPLCAAETCKTAKRLSDGRARALYAGHIDCLPENTLYTFADIGMKYPVMLEASQTFPYGETDPVQACMACEAYYYKEDGGQYLNRTLDSIGTAYPIACDSTGLYEAGSNGVRRLIIDVSDTGWLRLKTAEAAYVSCDEDGNASYTAEKDGETVEISAAQYQQLYDRYLSAAVVSFDQASPANIIPDADLESLKLLEAASGHRMETYISADLNCDGSEEYIGAFAKDYSWQFWYLDPASGATEQLPQMSQSFDECSLVPIHHDNETHVAANAYNLMGNNKRFSIFAIRDSQIQTLVPDCYGYVWQNEQGEIILNVEAYDGCYDPSIDVYLMHTWKDTYLYYDNGVYREYGALELSEAQFLRYENAADILSDIRTAYPDGDIRFSYFLRENGVVHVQCRAVEPDGWISFFYYTLYVDGTRLTGGLENYYDGQMWNSFSPFEVTYPDIFPLGAF